MELHQTLSVLIVSEVRLYREGLTQVLGQDGRLEVVGVLQDATRTLETVSRLQPEVALLDVAIPDILGTIEELAQSAPRTRVVALGLRESPRDVLACAEAGIDGYVCRDGSVEDLVQTARRAVRREFRCSQRIAAALVHRVRRLSAQSGGGPEAALTPRESEIVALIGEGLTNKQIAARLCIEVATVKTHVHNILEKLGARNRTEAAAKVGKVARPRLRSRPQSLQATP